MYDPLFFTDKDINFLPQTSVKASLYIPNAPEGSEEDRIKFLGKLARKKDCGLGNNLSFQEIHHFAKLPEDYYQALIYGASSNCKFIFSQYCFNKNGKKC